MLRYCNWHTALFSERIMTASASRCIHLISVAFQYSATLQTGGLSINCIYVLSVYPTLTFIIPPIHIIRDVTYGVNQLIYVHSFLNKICIAPHQYIPANLKSNILPYHLACSASHIELNFCNYLPLTVL